MVVVVVGAVREGEDGVAVGGGGGVGDAEAGGGCFFAEDGYSGESPGGAGG